MGDVNLSLAPRITPGAAVTETSPGLWKMVLPPGPSGQYRLAQLDDYSSVSRPFFPWKPPTHFSIQARRNQGDIPGTWGFGLWNDPFSLSLGLGGATRRIPSLPQAAWFFFASAPNYLSLRDDLPPCGALAATFRSAAIPPLGLLSSMPALPLLAWPPSARLLRRIARQFIHQDAVVLTHKPNPNTTLEEWTEWHTFDLDWSSNEVQFRVDGILILRSPITPRAPLGLVIWVDNQYASLPPDGRLAYGTLPNHQPAWVEVKNLHIQHGE